MPRASVGLLLLAPHATRKVYAVLHSARTVFALYAMHTLPFVAVLATVAAWGLLHHVGCLASLTCLLVGMVRMFVSEHFRTSGTCHPAGSLATCQPWRLRPGEGLVPWLAVP